MVKIRLSKKGAKGNVFYRIVAISESTKVTGKALDTIGYWHPSKNSKKIDKQKLEEWIKKGAQVSQAVSKLISN